MESYTERVKGAVFEEHFMYTDCYDDSANFAPLHAHITKVHVALVCSVCCFLIIIIIITEFIVHLSQIKNIGPLQKSEIHGKDMKNIQKILKATLK